MSKKSAKSKGYRYYKKDKPFLTKKEIYALIAICAVIIIGFIAFLCYDDGALKIKNGSIEGMETNWIVYNGGTTAAPRYFKLAEAGDVDGYTRLPTMSYSDYNLYDTYYYPATEENPVEYISVSTTSIKNTSVAEFGQTVVDTLNSMDGYTVTSPLTEAKVGDTPYSYYAFTSERYVEPTETEETAGETEAAAEETTEEAEPAPNSFGQSLNAYVEGPHDGCVLVHVINETESAEEFLSDDELKVILEQIIAAIDLEEK